MQARTTTFTYYDASGLLKSETVEPDSVVNGVKRVTEFEYDASGNQTKATVRGWNGEVSEDRVTSTQWDDLRRFPKSIQNPKLHYCPVKS